ncbi:MAG: hypothetical protein IKY02_06580 [Lachnospiraceae bacterium]|nr:hypothetical protein [Lachnospiraceae bacterium]
MAKKKVPFGKKVQRAKTAVKVGKGGVKFYKDVLPWILVGFAAVAYAWFSIPIPERKERANYKETW